MTDRVKLSANAERVLRLLVERGPMRVKEMVPLLDVVEQTVFRMVKSLSRDGLIKTERDGVKTATPAGREWLTNREEEFDVEPALPIDALDLAPSPLHAIGIELGLCAIVARRYGIDQRGLASLLIVGGPNSCKTGIGESIIILSGAGKLVEISLPGGRDLLLRKDSRGVEVTRCELLEELVVVFDELQKVTDPMIRKTIEQMYMHGTAKVTLPDTVIQVGVTTVAAMNPCAPPSAGFSARTNLHESLERRVVWVDLEGWRAPDELLKQKKTWREALAAADAGRAEKLPAPRNPTLDVAERLRATLRLIVRDPAALDEERLDYVLWSNLAAASTAWFKSDEEAFRFIVWAWARISERRYPLFEDWEMRLRMHFAPKKTAKEIEDQRWRSEVMALVAAVGTSMKGNLPLAKKLVENVPLRALGGIVRTKLGGDYKKARRALEFLVWLEEQGVTLDTVQRLAARAAYIGVGAHPEGARYLLSLGHAQYLEGRRIRDTAGRLSPNWPDPFTQSASSGKSKAARGNTEGPGRG